MNNRSDTSQTKIDQLDGVTIDAFIAWVTDAIDCEPMSQEAKQVVDALLEQSQRLRDQEMRLKQEARYFWTHDQQEAARAPKQVWCEECGGEHIPPVHRRQREAGWVRI